MEPGFNIPYLNPNNSLNNGITLAYPAKEDKVWFDNWNVSYPDGPITARYRFM